MTDLTKQSSKLRAAGAGLWAFLVRWQEHAGWLPLAVALTLLAFVFLPALDKTAGTDTLPILAVLPIKIAYAIAAGGLLFLIRRRWRRKLNKDEQTELWRQLLDGKRGAIAIYAGDLVFSICALKFLLSHFSLPG